MVRPTCARAAARPEPNPGGPAKAPFSGSAYSPLVQLIDARSRAAKPQIQSRGPFFVGLVAACYIASAHAFPAIYGKHGERHRRCARRESAGQITVRIGGHAAAT